MKWRSKEGLPTDEQLLEYRSFNRHVAVYKAILKGSVDPVEVRKRIKEITRPNILRGLAIGAFLVTETLPENIDDFMESIDAVQRERSVWQWTIIQVKEHSLAIGLHTWMRTFSTPVYDQMLGELSQAGYQVERFTKEKGRVMSVLTRLDPRYRDRDYRQT